MRRCLVIGIVKSMEMGVKHCCERMACEVTKTCPEHPEPFACPDKLIHYAERFDEYGLVVHDGGSSSIVIAHCPWCGYRLPPSRREACFEDLRARGIDPWAQDDLSALDDPDRRAHE